MSSAPGSSFRFWVLVAMLVATGLFLHSRTRPETLPPRQPLEKLPLHIGQWVGQETSLSAEVLKVLGDGEFLLRIYRSVHEQAHIDLFVAFFPSQRAGDTIHSPQNCLPGAGWEPVESARVALPSADGSTAIVNRYVIAKGLDRQLVLYWYQAHGRIVASEYWAKFWLVADAIRMNRSDGSLVRVITPLGREESPESGQKRILEFVSHISPALDAFIPR